MTDNTTIPTIQLIECPRDAMQGWKHFIPTDRKIEYLNALLRVGFHTIDFGSFVSPKAIPQMADTAQVLSGLELEGSPSRLLAIVANLRGAQEAAAYKEISYLGFPFSISPTFQQRNTNSTIEESVKRVEEIQSLCRQQEKQLVVYLSMGFGNPYGDEYHSGILEKWADAMVDRGVRIVSLADTVGLASPLQVSEAVQTLVPRYPGATIGVHLHCTPDNWRDKLKAALDAGCRRIDGAINGIGGCPMAGNELVGNMDTLRIVDFLAEEGPLPQIDRDALARSQALANTIFS